MYFYYLYLMTLIPNSVCRFFDPLLLLYVVRCQVMYDLWHKNLKYLNGVLINTQLQYVPWWKEGNDEEL
jgi:hypothetical protein